MCGKMQSSAGEVTARPTPKVRASRILVTLISGVNQNLEASVYFIRRKQRTRRGGDHGTTSSCMRFLPQLYVPLDADRISIH